MSKKVLPNGMTVYRNLTAREAMDFGARRRAAGAPSNAPVTARAIKEGKQIKVNPDLARDPQNTKDVHED